MLKKLNKKSGNRYTMISIIIIILVIYFFKLSFGGSGEENYPQDVYYGDYEYHYSQTISESSLKFARKYGMSYEGHVLLLKRGQNDKTAPSKVYIFTGRRKYREYELLQN